MSQPCWNNQRLEIPGDTSDRLSMEFEMAVFEALERQDPFDVNTLFHLGEIYTRSGLYELGLQVDRKLVEILPDNEVVNYNLACSYSLTGDIDAALETLERSLELGYKEFEFMETDSDLENLRNDKRFEMLLARYHAGHAGTPEDQVDF